MTQSPLGAGAAEAAPVAAPSRVPGLFGRGMPRRVGPLLSLFAKRFLDRIPFPDDVATRV